MNLLKLGHYLLWILVIGGTYNALLLSYNDFMGFSGCPSISFLPICYLVFAGYLTMLISLAKTDRGLRTPFFYVGWSVVFSIAVLGALFELISSGTCPSSNFGFPLCYVSLIISSVIFFLYKKSRLP